MNSLNHTIFIVLFMGHILIGQTFITNTSPIDDTRYSEYDGSPYFFKDNKSVDLYLTGDDKPYNVVLNINLHEKEVEVFKGNEFAAISLNEIESINAGELGVISSVNGNIWIEHFKDYKYHLVNNPKMSIRETTTNLPGEIVEKKTFIIKNDYTLSMGGESHSIKMKKKSIVSVLGKEADKTAKKTKNKLKSVNDLVLLLTTLTSM